MPSLQMIRHGLTETRYQVGSSRKNLQVSSPITNIWKSIYNLCLPRYDIMSNNTKLHTSMVRCLWWTLCILLCKESGRFNKTTLDMSSGIRILSIAIDLYLTWILTRWVLQNRMLLKLAIRYLRRCWCSELPFLFHVSSLLWNCRCLIIDKLGCFAKTYSISNRKRDGTCSWNITTGSNYHYHQTTTVDFLISCYTIKIIFSIVRCIIMYKTFLHPIAICFYVMWCWWFSAWLQCLQCVSNGDTAVFH